MLTLGFALRGESAWRIPVLATSSAKREGIGELLAAIDRHRRTLDESGEMERRRRAIARTRMLKTAENILHDRFEKQQDGKVSSLIERVVTRELNPHTAATELIAALKSEP